VDGWGASAESAKALYRVLNAFGVQKSQWAMLSAIQTAHDMESNVMGTPIHPDVFITSFVKRAKRIASTYHVNTNVLGNLA
jgi:hypothetical protein